MKQTIQSGKKNLASLGDLSGFHTASRTVVTGRSQINVANIQTR